MSAPSHAGPASETRRADGRAGSLEIARRQALSREINERIPAKAEAHELEVICECASCSFEALTIARHQYEAVRRFPTRFVVKPGHTAPEEERVVEEAAGYLVVEKIGPGARTAIRFDPRGSHRRPQRSVRMKSAE